MCKLKLFIIIVALLSLGASAAPVAASSPPLDVKIEVTTVFPPEGPSYGPFVATGPAVDAGLICPSGDTIDVASSVSGWQSGRGLNFSILKQFTCADGSGTFVAKLQVRSDFRGDYANWIIFSGTGNYASLLGSGKLVGIYFEDGSGILDIYTGQVHSE
jgi:hypothetical protein